MKMKANAVKYGQRSLIWLLIAVMLMGTLAACDPGVLPDDTSADEATTTEPTETDPVETDPVETDPVDTDPVETDPVETEGAHSLSAVAANEATCTEDGNIAYWTCSHCDKIYGDAEGKSEITAESIVVPAKGHTEEIIPAVEPTYDTVGASEGRKCSVCGEITLKPVEIPVKEDNWYFVTFVVPGVEGEPKTEKYEITKGVMLGEDSYPERAGYKCDGWYDKAEGGEKVVFIPEGNTDSVVLYAHWSLKKYHITYADYKVNDNPTEYTIEDEIVLRNPEWSGLVFTHWTDSTGQIVSEIDKNGKTIVKIPEGSTGNIVLTANWKTKRNMVTVYTNEREIKVLDSHKDEGLYQFLYPLGYIENVVLEEIAESQGKSENASVDIYLSETNTIEQDISKTISETIAHSVLNSSQWSQTSGWGEKYHIDVGGTFSFSGGCDNIVKAMVEYSASLNYGQESDWNKSVTYAGNTDVGSENTNTVASTFSYKEVMSVTQGITHTIEASAPSGQYSYVRAGTVYVYAVISYAANTCEYYLDTFSLVDNIHAVPLYYRDQADLDNSKVYDPIPYDVPMGDIVGTINNAYYVLYDANGGAGKMPMTVFTNGQEYSLPANAFTREGYTFDGWTVEGSDAVLNDGATIKDLAQAGKSVVLKAKWKEHSYTVHYDYHDGSGKVESVLRKYSETYTLPEPTRTGYTFKGWSTNPNASVGEYEGNSEISVLTAEDEGTVTLYAIWNVNYYTVRYQYYAGKADRTEQVAYGSKIDRSEVPNRHGWFFSSWSGETVMPDHDVVLTAQWEIDNHYSGSWSGQMLVDDTNSKVFYIHSEGITNELNLSDLRSIYANAHIQVSFSITEIDDGYQDMFYFSTDQLDWSNASFDGNDLVGQDGKLYTWLNIETAGSDKGSGTHTANIYTSSANIKSLQAVVFNAHGSFEDDYYVTNVTINIWFYN